MSEPRVEAESQLRSQRWLLVAPGLLLLWIVGQIDKTNISLIVANEPFLKELNLVGHNTELGGLMTAFLLGYGFAIFLWGFLVDRFGPRLCAIVGILCWGAFLFLSSRVSTIGQLLALRFLLGVAEGNLWPVGNALTNRWFPVREHSRAQAFWVTGSSLGTAIGVPIVTTLVLASGWRVTLEWLALLSLIPILPLAFVADRPAAKNALSSGHAARMDGAEAISLRELFTETSFWLIAFCQFVSATSIFTLVQWIPRFLTSYRHMPFKIMGHWIALGYVLATVLTLLICYLADRSMQRSLTGMWVCVLFSLAILPAAFLLPAIWTAVLLSTSIVIATTTASMNAALMHRLVRPEAIARGTGIYVGIGNSLSGIGPAIFGYLISQLGGEYWGGFLFLAVISVLGAGSYFALHLIANRSVRPVEFAFTSPRGQ